MPDDSDAVLRAAYADLVKDLNGVLDLDMGAWHVTHAGTYTALADDLAGQLDLDQGLAAIIKGQPERSRDPSPSRRRPLTTTNVSRDDPPPQRSLRGPGRLLVAVAAAVLAVMAVHGVLEGPCDTITTSQTSTGECVGVSDGSVVFSPDLATITGLIRSENLNVDTQVAQRPGAQSVSLAVLAPFPKAESNARTSAAMTTLRELQGAYLAQLRANDTDGAPLIRLLIVNTGQDNAHWPSAVEQLRALAEPGAAQNLVGVVLLGPSVSTTNDMITALNEARIPIIASRVTADDLTGDSGDLLSGFASVAPSTRDQATAATQALRGTTQRVLLVRDSNPSDAYSAILGSSFAAAYPDRTHALLQPVQYYNSSLPAVENAFSELNSTICEQAQANPAAEALT
jgi:hypothetical protein